MTIFGATISMAVFWIIVAVVFGIIEGITLGLITIWFTGGALVAAIASLFDIGIIPQIVIFMVASIAMMIFSRPALKKHLEKGGAQTNVEAILNKEGIVEEDIEPLKVGAVRVNGLVWSAINKDGLSIKKGEVVVIKAIEGIKVIVELAERR